MPLELQNTVKFATWSTVPLTKLTWPISTVHLSDTCPGTSVFRIPACTDSCRCTPGRIQRLKGPHLKGGLDAGNEFPENTNFTSKLPGSVLLKSSRTRSRFPESSGSRKDWVTLMEMRFNRGNQRERLLFMFTNGSLPHRKTKRGNERSSPSTLCSLHSMEKWIKHSLTRVNCLLSILY